MQRYIELENMPSAALMLASRACLETEHGTAAEKVRAWAAFLRELVGAGPLRIGTSQPAVTLEHHGNWPGVRIDDAFGIASGRRFTLWMLLDHWSHVDGCGTVAEERDRSSNISILDRAGAPLLDLGCGLEHRWSPSDILNRCRTPSRTRSPLEPASQRDGDAVELDSNPLRERIAGLGDTLDVADLAEATDQIRLSPARLREGGYASAVDAELVPCFLEALADQALPVRIVTGTAGVAHSLDCAFFCHRRAGVSQTLGSDSARFRIDTSQIDSAWVLRVSQGAHERTSLRLYDAQGRLLAKISSLPGFVAIENPIWRTLVNALQD